MGRFLFLALVMVASQVCYANEVSDFFDRLQGKWELKEGEITNIDPRANPTRLKITKLVSTVEKTNDKEWKFVEHYCVETDCVDTTYFYVLDDHDDLFLVTQEGRSELIIIHSNSNKIKFLLRNEGSYSITDCVVDGNEMVQEGLTMNSDFSQSSVKIVLSKSE